MRRSLCLCEPHVAFAGQEDTWKFIYTTATTVRKGAKLKFDLLTKGRDIDWDIPSVSPKKKGNVIYGYCDAKKKVVAAREVKAADSLVPQYEFVLPCDIKSGETFTICIGAASGASNTAEKSRCQTTLQRRRSFLLYIDAKGDGNYDDPEIFNMDIRGGELETIKIITPSFVERNRRFDVTIRFEDEYGNLTSNAPEGTLVKLTYENQRENFNWKLFVPETGFITVPNFYFNEPGVYKIQLTNDYNGELFYSSPIKCFPKTERSIFWGLFHGESERVDSTENIEACMRYFRDDSALNFFGVSPFESQDETPNDIWKLISQNIIDFNEDERFSTFLGFQWQGNSSQEGIRNIVYSKEAKSILRKKDAKSSTLKKIYKNSVPQELISIPCFTMGKGMSYDFSTYNPEFERVIEIYNAWGSSECTKKEENIIPISSSSKNGVKEDADGSVKNALLNNCRFGFVAGGLDDRGCYTPFFDTDQEQYTSGLTAIITGEHTRDSLFKALYERSCYATTGERMIVDFSIAGTPMGAEVSTVDKPGLGVNRHISGVAAGTEKLDVVEILRNGEVIKTFEPDEYEYEFIFDDMDALDDVSLTSPKKGEVPFIFYYIRVVQEDGHTAWSSPIWIDDMRDNKKKKK
jgi:hypothetical protein